MTKLPVNENSAPSEMYYDVTSNDHPYINSDRRRITIAFCLSIFNLIATVCIVIFLVTYLSSKPTCSAMKTEEENASKPTTSHDEHSNQSKGSDVSGDESVTGKLKIVSRSEWLAAPPTEELSPLQHPVPYVIIMHSASRNCSTRKECVEFVRQTQGFHIKKNGWSDIGYNFLVGGDGDVYEGRGWDTVGAFSYGYNSRGIGIVFIGTFTEIPPPPEQLHSGQQLIAKGVELGKISPEYKLLAHRQISATESPGKFLFEEIQKWPHWIQEL